MNIHLVILVLCYCCDWSSGVTTQHPDIEYKTIRIPQSVWEQATQIPRLKTPATFVVPIEVEAEEADESEVENEIEDEIVPVTEVIQQPILDEEPTITNTTSEDVVGQAIRFPCSCVEGQCGCCTGVLLQRINMKACGNITFIPEDFVFDMKFSVNNNTVMQRRVSAQDPPPICFNPRRAPFVEVCAELSNIHVKDRNAHACLDIDANIGGFSVYSTSFRCFSLGRGGVQTGLKPKPVETPGPQPTNLFGSGSNDNDDDEEGILDGAAEGLFGGDDEDGGGLLDGAADGIFGGDGGGDGDGPDLGGVVGGLGDIFTA